MAIGSTKGDINVYRTDKQYVRASFIEFCFSPDFRVFLLNKICLYEFTPTQALIISILVEHLEAGIKKVPQSVILGRVLGDDSDKNPILKSYFKSAGKVHLAWGTFIKSTGGRDASVYLDFECLISPSSTPSLSLSEIIESSNVRRE
jgi:hypothetical protein